MTKTRAQRQAAGTSEKAVLSPPQGKGKGKVSKRGVKSSSSGAPAGPSRRATSSSPSPPPPSQSPTPPPPSQSPTPPSPGSESDPPSYSRCVLNKKGESINESINHGSTYKKRINLIT